LRLPHREPLAAEADETDGIKQKSKAEACDGERLGTVELIAPNDGARRMAPAQSNTAPLLRGISTSHFLPSITVA
jgi:hypothetical protein